MNLQIKTRDELPSLLKKLDLDGEGVEIGVHIGVYSKKILASCDLKVLYSIDPWIKLSKKEYDDIANFPQIIQNLVYLSAIIKLNKFIRGVKC